MSERTLGTPQPPTLPATRRPINLQSQTVGPLGILTSLQPDIERARIAHTLQYPETVSEILLRVIAEAQACVETGALSDEVRACFDLLLGSANCLLGRSAVASANEQLAMEYFHKAVVLFAARSDAIDDQRNRSQLWTDYGLALYKTGAAESTIFALRKAESTGAASQETFNFLALAYLAAARPSERREMIAEALKAANKGLQLAPGDIGIHVTLAEIHKAAGDVDAAVAAYVDGALGAARKNDMEAANDLIARALALAPSHPLAVGLAVELKRTQQDLAGALAVVNAVLGDNGEPSWALALKGKLLHDQGRFDEALATLQHVTIDSETSWVPAEIAGVLFDLDRIPEASAAIGEALRRQPQDPAATLLKGRLLIEQSREEEAIPVLERALTLNPDSPLGLFELGRARFACRRYAEAVRDFDAALDLVPDWAEAAAAKAEALFLHGDYPGALKQARRTLKLNRGDPMMLNLIYDAAEKIDRVDDALREIERELARDPSSKVAWYLKGTILLDRDEYEEAQEALTKAAALDPTNADVHMALSNALRLLGRYDEAGAACEIALDCEPTAYSLGWAGIYLSEVGEFAKACEVLSRATVSFADASWLWAAYGWALQYRDLISAQQSLECYAKALALDGDNRSVWNVKGLADAHLLCGRDDDARTQFRAILREFSNTADSSIKYVHGWAHYRLGEYAEAAALLKEVGNFFPEYVFAHFDHGLAWLAAGRLGHARAAYARAISQLDNLHRLRQRGLLYVAAFDVVDGARSGRIGRGGYMAFELLKKHLDRLALHETNAPWLLGDWFSTAQ